MAARAINTLVPHLPYTDVVVLQNPTSKHADLADQRISRLTEMFPGRVHPLDSDPSLEVTRRDVHAKLLGHLADGREPIFAVAGGDGTVNMALQMIASASTRAVLRDIPIMPLGTGNANDLAYMLFHNPADLEEMFKQSRHVEINPLQFLIVPPGKDPQDPSVLRIAERHIASNYISFGASAHGARELNKKSVRKQARGEEAEEADTELEKGFARFKHKVYGQHVPDFLALRAAVQAAPFEIEHDGKRLEIREILFGNGNRAAKVGKMPAQLHKPEFFMAMVRNRLFGRTALLLDAIKMIRGKLPGRVLENASYTFKVLQDVPVQYDGETSMVLAGSTIIVSHADIAFHALTTKLKG